MLFSNSTKTLAFRKGLNRECVYKICLAMFPFWSHNEKENKGERPRN